MPLAPVNDTELYYESLGDSGPRVLLIMGLRARGNAFTPLVSRLERDHQVVLFDNRGVGGSAALGGPLSMSVMAQDAVGLMDHLGWETAHLVGVSMGGMVAQHVALEHKQRLQSLSLITTTAYGRGAVVPSLSTLRLYLGTLMGSQRSRLGWLARLLYSVEHLEREGVEPQIDRLIQAFGHDKPGTWKAQVQAISNHDVRARLGELDPLPLLLLSAGKDRLIANTHTALLREALPKAQVAHFEHAGHGVLAECADQVAAAVRARLASV